VGAAEDAARSAGEREQATDFRDRLEDGGLERGGDDDEPDDCDDLVACQRADADAEGAEQGSDGQVAPQHVGDAAGAQRCLPAV
jgi:hypothetical protein